MPVKHTHKLKRHRYKSGMVTYFCCLPDCSFKIQPALALGKRCVCWRCGEDFIMTDYSIRLAKPHCEKCHKPKDAEEMNAPSYIITTDIPPNEEIMALVKSKENEVVLSLRDRLNQTVKSAEEGEDI